MAKKFEELKINCKGIDLGYHHFVPTLANALLFFIMMFHMPKKLFRFLLYYAKPASEKQHMFYFLHFLLRMIYLLREVYFNLKFMFFNQLPGRLGIILWKLGVIQAVQKKHLLYVRRKLKIDSQIS